MGIMQENEIVWIGTRSAWGGERPFGLRRVDRRQHVFVVGKSGTGKTTLLRNLILQDIQAGRGVGIVDPYGDLALDLLDHIPPSRTDDVVYFNPADQDYPIGFNLLARVPNVKLRITLRLEPISRSYRNVHCGLARRAAELG